MGISSRVFFLHSYRAFACRHEQLRLASAEGVIAGAERRNVYLLADEDGRGDLSAR